MEKQKTVSIIVSAVNFVFGVVFCALLAWVISKLPDTIPLNFNHTNGAVEIISTGSKLAVFLPFAILTALVGIGGSVWSAVQTVKINYKSSFIVGGVTIAVNLVLIIAALFAYSIISSAL